MARKKSTRIGREVASLKSLRRGKSLSKRKRGSRTFFVPGESAKRNGTTNRRNGRFVEPKYVDEFLRRLKKERIAIIKNSSADEFEDIFSAKATISKHGNCHICHCRRPLICHFSCGINQHAYCENHCLDRLGLNISLANKDFTFNDCPICSLKCTCAKCVREVQSFASILKKNCIQQGLGLKETRMKISPAGTIFFKRKLSSSRMDVEEEVAGTALKNIPGVECKEADMALKEIGPPFGLQNAMKKIYNLRQTKKSLVGFKVRKFFTGKEFHGIVVGEPRMIIPPHHNSRGKTSELLNHWPVEYGDADTEEMTYDELMQWSAVRPQLVAICRGRALQMLELFCGSAVVTSEFAQRQWKTDSIDISKESNATIIKDIQEIEHTDLRFVPDFIWASLPCETYSCAAGNYHRSIRTANLDKSKKARDHNLIFLQMTKLMAWAKENHPHLIVVIENPVGTLKKMPLMKEFTDRFGLHSVTVNYCAFGRDEMKPTMIWTNDWGLKSSLQEYTCEEKCQHYGKKTRHILQVSSGTHDCSVIPQPLAEEVAAYVNAKFIMSRIQKRKTAVLTSFN